MPKSDRSSPSQEPPQRKKAERQIRPGTHAPADGLELRSYDIGALPLLNQILDRMQLGRRLHHHPPKDHPPTERSSVTALLGLIANLLLAREPVYGVGE